MKKKLIIIAVLLLLLIAVRFSACPKIAPSPQLTPLAETESEQVENELKIKTLSQEELINKIKEKKILLFGEAHRQPKIMNYFAGILDSLPAKIIVVNLELPSKMQPFIDNYMNTGDSVLLGQFDECQDCLPYKSILKACFLNRNKVVKVFAVDENRTSVVLNRCFCTDTRNESMTDKIFETINNYPDAQIIFYGGSMHTLLSGRYLYDVENRTPIGKRLLDRGIKKEDLNTIVLELNKNFLLSDMWDKNGAVNIHEIQSKIPYMYFFNNQIFGVKYAEELFDYFINVNE